MRWVIIIFAILCLSIGKFSFAQDGTERSNANHYLLIDNSGSMAKYRESVDTEVADNITNQLLGENVSVTHFRGIDRDDCESAVTLSALQKYAERPEFAPPIADGSTLIVNAIGALSTLDPDQAASVTLYTDGTYEDNECETPEDVCAHVQSLRTSHPLIDFRFQYPDAIRRTGRLVFSCAGNVSEQAPAIETGEEETEVKARMPMWPAVVSWSFLPWILVSLLAANIVSRRRYTKLIEQSYEIEDPKNEETSKEKTARRSLLGLLAISVGSLVIFSFSFFGSITFPAFVVVYEEANRPLLAIVFAWALTVVSGWYFVEWMNDTRARQDRKWRVNQKTALERAEAKEVSRIQESLMNRFTEQQDRESARILRVQDALSDDEKARLSELILKVDSVRGQISEKVASVTSFKVLDRHQSATYSNLRSILRLLEASGNITAELNTEITLFFNNWERLLTRLPSLNDQLEQKVLGASITWPEPVQTQATD